MTLKQFMKHERGKRGLGFYGIWAAVAFGIILSVAIVFVIWVQRHGPRFDRDANASGPYLNVEYSFLDPIPFSGGLMPILATTSTNSRTVYVLDIAAAKIVGELQNGWPLAIDGKNQQLLCKSVKKPLNPLQARLYRTFQQVFRLKLPAETDEHYWVINLRTGRSTLIGQIPEPIMNSTMVPSPSFSRAYLLDNHSPTKCDLVIIDVLNKRLQRCELPGWPLGWWSDSEILFKPDQGGFGIYNLASKATASLISDVEWADWLEQQDIEVEAKKVGAFPVWDGSQYQFVATDTHSKWLATTSFLAKVTIESPNLKLIDDNFKFGWSDHLSPNGQHYIYTGREPGKDSSAVFIRTIQTASDRIIVPPDGKYFSIPRFHGDSIIFVRNKKLWKTDLNGSNTVQLFPPAERK